jgi:hypothetical protein
MKDHPPPIEDRAKRTDYEGLFFGFGLIAVAAGSGQ